MYEVFTGMPPFEADSFYEMVRQHVDDVPSHLPFADPSLKIPVGLEAIIFKTLQKDPALRQQTAAQLKLELIALAPRAQAVS
jgi:serine/threonine-protein kinase